LTFVSRSGNGRLPSWTIMFYLRIWHFNNRSTNWISITNSNARELILFVAARESSMIALIYEDDNVKRCVDS